MQGRDNTCVQTFVDLFHQWSKTSPNYISITEMATPPPSTINNHENSLTNFDHDAVLKIQIPHLSPDVISTCTIFVNQKVWFAKLCTFRWYVMRFRNLYVVCEDPVLGWSRPLFLHVEAARYYANNPVFNPRGLALQSRGSKRTKDGPEHFQVDHKDHNTLNCVCISSGPDYPSNLRICTNQQNAWNRRPRETYGGRQVSSQYKGVSRTKAGNWKVDFGSKKLVPCGRIRKTFDTEIKAAKFYDACAIKYYKEFAVLNFPSSV